MQNYANLNLKTKYFDNHCGPILKFGMFGRTVVYPTRLLPRACLIRPPESSEVENFKASARKIVRKAFERKGNCEDHVIE